MPEIWFDHIGIACESNDKSEKFWSLLGFNITGQEENVQQGVKIRFMEGNNAPQPRLELLEPISEDTPVGRFISKRGAGVQQVALATDDLTGLLGILKFNNIRLINKGSKDLTEAYISLWSDPDVGDFTNPEMLS